MLRAKLIVLLSILVLSCQQKSVVPEGYDPGIYEQALKIAQSTIVLDGHVDVPYRLVEQQKMDDISQATTKGDFDFPRAKQGGLDAPFMSIYIPADYQKEHGVSKKHAEKLIAMMDSIIAINWDKFAPAITPDDVKRNFEKGLISFPYGMENGSAIEDDLSNVEYFYQKGIRYITLTHGKKNLICDSSYDPDNKDWNGLSPFGRKVVSEMNRLGIMVDISHVSVETMKDALRVSRAPIIASHSSAYALCPHPRNIPDEVLRDVTRNGGVIMVNFFSDFIDPEGGRIMSESYAARRKLQAQYPDDEAFDRAWDRWHREHPIPRGRLSQVVDHIVHIAKVAGIDHVGLGSDYDGISKTPVGLDDVSRFPAITQALLDRDFSPEAIRKILGGNLLTAFRRAEQVARMLQAEE